MSFSENFIEIMDNIGKNIGIAIDWTNKNVLPYMEELCGKIINYELYTSIAWLIFSLLIMVIGIVMMINANKEKNNPKREFYDDWYILFFVIGGGLVLVGVITTMTQIGDIITCLTLPEKVIMEFIMKYK